MLKCMSALRKIAINYDECVGTTVVGNAIGNSIVDASTPKTKQPYQQLAEDIDASSQQSLSAWAQQGIDELANKVPTLSVNPETDFTPGMLGGDAQREQSRGIDDGSANRKTQKGTEEIGPNSERLGPSLVVDPTANAAEAYDIESFVDDPNRVMINNGIRNERGQYARNPLKQSALGGKEPVLGAKTALDLFKFGDPAEQTSIPLVGDGDYLNLTNTREFSGAGELGKEGFSLDFTGKSTTEIRYGDSLRLPSVIPELLGQVDARSVLDASLTGTTKIGPGGAELGAGFRAEAVAVQVPFQVKLEKEYEFLKLGVEVSGAGNLGGVGGVAGAGVALTTRGARAYLEAGATPLIGGRVRVSGSIEFKPQIVSYVSNPAHNPLAPLGAWIGRKLYDIGHSN